MPPTYTISVPDPQPGIPPGDRWCALSGPRAPLPAILGTADEWLLIAGAIEAGAARAFGRVAFEARIGGGELWSPHNSTGDRDHVRLTTAELVELAADIRAKLVPPTDTTGTAMPPGARTFDGRRHNLRCLTCNCGFIAADRRCPNNCPGVADYDACLSGCHPRSDVGE